LGWVGAGSPITLCSTDNALEGPLLNCAGAWNTGTECRNADSRRRTERERGRGRVRGPVSDRGDGRGGGRQDVHHHAPAVRELRDRVPGGSRDWPSAGHVTRRSSRDRVPGDGRGASQRRLRAGRAPGHTRYSRHVRYATSVRRSLARPFSSRPAFAPLACHMHEDT